MFPSRTWRITSENRDLASYVEYVMAMVSILTGQTRLLKTSSCLHQVCVRERAGVAPRPPIEA